MKVSTITSCYIGPEISPEQFIPEHFFLYLLKGSMTVYDGNKTYRIQPGDSGIARRNHLAKYNKQKTNDEFEKVVLVFDQAFLKSFSKQYNYTAGKIKMRDAIIPLEKNPMIENFVRSLSVYFSSNGSLRPEFLDVKRTELLLILLQQDPRLPAVLFDFSEPQKIDLEAFMNKNYRFNISLERFAYMTGRSLSGFKRDFQKTFNATPGNWLVQKRLTEAYFLIEKKGKRPVDIYLDLGFEDLSHFSFAFKKAFRITPAQLAERKKRGKS